MKNRLVVLTVFSLSVIVIEVTAWGYCFSTTKQKRSSSSIVPAFLRTSQKSFLLLYQNGSEEIRNPSSSSPSLARSSSSSSSPSSSQSSSSMSNNNNSTRIYYQNEEREIEFPTRRSLGDNIVRNTSTEVEEDDDVAKGTLGDIMSGFTSRRKNDRPSSTTTAKDVLADGLVTSESASLSTAFGITNPLDRMAVTANGNLQRLFSSYYDTPVRVRVEKCERRNDDRLNNPQRSQDETQQMSSFTSAAAIWDRTVLLTIFDHDDDHLQNVASTDSESIVSPSRTVLCRADSVIYVHDEQVESLVESGRVGIGQLFRHFNILPDFHLLEAGRCDRPFQIDNDCNQNGNIDHVGCVTNEIDPDSCSPSDEDTGFWRRYQLTSDLVTCDIHEVFCPNLWELTPPSSDHSSMLERR